VNAGSSVAFREIGNMSPKKTADGFVTYEPGHKRHDQYPDPVWDSFWPLIEHIMSKPKTTQKATIKELGKHELAIKANFNPTYVLLSCQ
jgi:hypothetical protein